jgi:putative phosphoesterase
LAKTIGVISDTHGMLRPEVLDAFHDVDLILHAGDIGRSEVLQKLQAVAPIIAVRGNNDEGEWSVKIPEHRITKVEAVSIYMLHDLKQLEISGAESFQVVISGHSHRPHIENRQGILFVNPGSAGPRRFKLPVTVARLTIQREKVSADLIQLQ